MLWVPNTNSILEHSYYQDISPETSLTKAFIQVSGILQPDAVSGEEKVLVQEMVKAFDDEKEILIENN